MPSPFSRYFGAKNPPKHGRTAPGYRFPHVQGPTASVVSKGEAMSMMSRRSMANRSYSPRMHQTQNPNGETDRKVLGKTSGNTVMHLGNELPVPKGPYIFVR